MFLLRIDLKVEPRTLIFKSLLEFEHAEANLRKWMKKLVQSNKFNNSQTFGLAQDLRNSISEITLIDSQEPNIQSTEENLLLIDLVKLSKRKLSPYKPNENMLEDSREEIKNYYGLNSIGHKLSGVGLGQQEPSITSAYSEAFNQQDGSPAKEITLVDESNRLEDVSDASRSGKIDIKSLMEQIFQNSSVTAFNQTHNQSEILV